MKAKRVFDFVCAAAGLLVLSPLLLAVAAAIRIFDGSPVFYRAERIGRGGRPFRIWKFRTMVNNADRQGRAITVGEDSRITTIGKLLRKLKLDEFPQLLNVVCGEMSLVGPRPEAGKYVKLYTASQQPVLDIQPGITDPASLKYRHESDLLGQAADPDRFYVESVMPDKIQISRHYAETANLYSDIGLILRTVGAIFDRGSRQPTSPAEVTICMLSSEHPAEDKRVFHKESRSLARAGFRVLHLCPGEANRRWTTEGVELLTYQRRRGKLPRLLALPRLFWQARALDADAYHCNEPDSWLVGVALRLLAGKIVVFDCHEHYPGQVVRWLPRGMRALGALATKYYLQALGLITHRIVLAKYSVADDFSWSQRRHVVVLNTTALAETQITDRNSSRESASRQPAEANAEPFTFVHIGVIRRERGSEQLLEAAVILAQRKIDFRVVLIGEFKDGSEADFFAKANAAGIADRIVLHPWMQFEQAFQIVERCHAGLILFQPSLANNVRGMPHKMFDYMSAGLPVIAPDFAPDIAGVLRESEAGMLADTGDPQTLANVMQQLIESPQLARRLGDRGRQAVIDRYNWEADAARLVDAYRELFQLPGDRPSAMAWQEEAA